MVTSLCFHRCPSTVDHLVTPGCDVCKILYLVCTFYIFIPPSMLSICPSSSSSLVRTSCNTWRVGTLLTPQNLAGKYRLHYSKRRFSGYTLQVAQSRAKPPSGCNVTYIYLLDSIGSLPWGLNTHTHTHTHTH